MSKSITIPTDRGSRVIVEINGVQYIYAAGSTVTVPDAVAACIADSVAMKPGGYRESKFDEAHESLEARVEALEAGGGGGSELPTVTSDDNGDVLTVVEGAWAKAAPAGGGVLVVTDTEGTLNKTWQEIHDAGFAVGYGISETADGLCISSSVGEEGGIYYIGFLDLANIAVDMRIYVTDSASGYPALSSD